MQECETKKISIPQENFQITKNHKIKTVRMEKILRSDVNDKRFLNPNFSPFVTHGYGTVSFDETNNWKNFEVAQKPREDWTTICLLNVKSVIFSGWRKMCFVFAIVLSAL